MSKSSDLEIQLVAEPESEVSADGATEVSKNPQPDQAVTEQVVPEQVELEQVELEQAEPNSVESGKVANEHSRVLSDSRTLRRKWSVLVSCIDPAFYITCLVCGGLLFIGFYVFVNHNNQLIVAHLKEIEVGNRQLSAQLALSKSESLLEMRPAETSQTESLSREHEGLAPVVQAQSLGQFAVVNPVSTQVAAKAATRAVNQAVNLSETQREIQASGDMNVSLPDARQDQSDEIARLQNLLSVKVQQLEYLALENHELRLQIEFGDTSDVYTGVIDQSFSTDSDDFNPEDNVSYSDSDQSLTTAHNTPLSAPIEETLVDSHELIKLASTAFKDKNYTDAGGFYLDALQQSPGNREANLGVASVALIAGNIQLAIDRYRHLLQLNPDDQSVFSALLDLAAPDNLIETELLGHASRFANDRSNLYSILGHYFGSTSRWDEANKAFTAALEGSANPSSNPLADILFNIAVSYEHLGQLDHAAKFYSQVLGATEDESVDYTLVHERLSKLKVQ